MVSAYGMMCLPHNHSGGNGQIPGGGFILSVDYTIQPCAILLIHPSQAQLTGSRAYERFTGNQIAKVLLVMARVGPRYGAQESYKHTFRKRCRYEKIRRT